MVIENRDLFNISLQCLIYNEKNELLLLKRRNTSYSNNMYALPGGHLEVNETIIDGIIRELDEEIGIKYKKEELNLVKVINRKINNDNYVDFIFNAKLLDNVLINNEPDKCSELMFVTSDHVPENTIPLVKEILNTQDFYITINENIN